MVEIEQLNWPTRIALATDGGLSLVTGSRNNRVLHRVHGAKVGTVAAVGGAIVVGSIR